MGTFCFINWKHLPDFNNLWIGIGMVHNIEYISRYGPKLKELLAIKAMLLKTVSEIDVESVSQPAADAGNTWNEHIIISKRMHEMTFTGTNRVLCISKTSLALNTQLRAQWPVLNGSKVNNYHLKVSSTLKINSNWIEKVFIAGYNILFLDLLLHWLGGCKTRHSGAHCEL